jgi:ubiquinone/menaquinone biosynthesis C-methylase UbiE
VDHQDHVALIRGAVEGAGPRWLELGAGTGAFTLALLDLLGAVADVTALDRDDGALRRLAQEAGRRFPSASVHILEADFSRPLPVEPASFDGVLMANSLHFVNRKEPVLRAAMETLRPGGRFVLIEYGSDRGNPWVPWPISFATWMALAESVGLEDTRRIGEVPSRFLGSIYSAASVRPAEDGQAAADAAGTPTPRSQ